MQSRHIFDDLSGLSIVITNETINHQTKFSLMTQLTINIEDKSILPHLKKILNAIDGVSIAKPERKKRKCGLDEALDDIKAGRITRYESVEAMYEALGI